VTGLEQSGKGFISLMPLYNGVQPIVTVMTTLKLEGINSVQSKILNSEIIDR
jgi:hypothetical protein